MQRVPSDERVLAIDVRLSRFGYCVYEGPKRLLDWGGRSCSAARGGSELAASRVAELMRLFRPAVIVLKEERRGGHRKTAEASQTVASIQQEAGRRCIRVVILRPEQVKEAFAAFRPKTKDDLAQILAEMFPGLVWELPRRRRRWDNEHPRLAVFDAIGVGYAYFQLKEERRLVG